jgi:hypothetical protein
MFANLGAPGDESLCTRPDGFGVFTGMTARQRVYFLQCSKQPTVWFNQWAYFSKGLVMKNSASKLLALCVVVSGLGACGGSSSDPAVPATPLTPAQPMALPDPLGNAIALVRPAVGVNPNLEGNWQTRCIVAVPANAVYPSYIKRVTFSANTSGSIVSAINEYKDATCSSADFKGSSLTVLPATVGNMVSNLGADFTGQALVFSTAAGLDMLRVGFVNASLTQARITTYTAPAAAPVFSHNQEIYDKQ